MNALAAKQDQHSAAMTYLDTGTLALAEILAALDEEPAEDGPDAPNATHRHHRRRSFSWGLWGVRTGAIAAAVAVGLFALTPHATEPVQATPPISSPFDDALFRAASVASGLDCAPQSAHTAACTDMTGYRVRIEAYDSDDSERYFVAGRTSTGAPGVQSLAVFDTAAAEDDFLKDYAAALPNVQHGARWVAWGSDPLCVQAATRTLPRQPDAPVPTAPKSSTSAPKTAPPALKSQASGHGKKASAKH